MISGFKQKVVAVIAEQSPISVIDSGLSVIRDNKADVLKLRLDCLDPQHLNERTIGTLRQAFPNTELMVSIRNVASIPETRIEEEGYKVGKHDLDRIALLRKAVEEGFQYFELEHQLRRNFFLLGKKPSKVVILYTNLKETPSKDNLITIYSDVLRLGADHVVFECTIKDRLKDRGKEDRSNLMTLLQESSKVDNFKPLTVVGRGKFGRNLNLEAYKLGLSQFVYGVVPSFSPIPFLDRKRVYHEMPTLDEVNRYLGRNS
ncbi:MAG: type I 3-dehydroquinate dehydratase [Nanoarchaeota archaeon]